MKEQILKLLTERKTFMKKSELLCYLYADESWKNKERLIRQAIEDLIHDGELIQSSEKGYCLITSEEQLNEARLYLQKKAKAISIRYNTLTASYNRKFAENKNQMNLNF